VRRESRCRVSAVCGETVRGGRVCGEKSRERRESRWRKTGCRKEQGRKAKYVSPYRMCSRMCVTMRDYMASYRTHSIWPYREHLSYVAI
jgi:hypothetical protein